MMKYFILFLVIFTSIIFPQASQYSFSSNLSPIKISYNDFASILNKASNFINGVNDSSIYKPTSELTIYYSNNSLTYKNLEKPDLFIDAPKVAYKAYFSFSSYENKISNISINFDDFSRQIKVEGQSYENCKALISMLENEFQSYTLTFGGSSFRLWGGLILFFLAFVIMWFPQIIKSQKLYIYIFSLVIGILLIISIYILPWDNWLPGFTIYFMYKNFLEEYSGILSVIGILLTILSVIISIYLSKKNTNSTLDNETKTELTNDAN